MRIFLKLVAAKDYQYDLKYYHKLQGFIYNLLKDTEYSILHDKKGYKFFCFSNIFPTKDTKSGERRNLIISSPDKLFIKILTKKLEEIRDNNKTINIGEMSFKIEDFYTFKLKIKSGCKLISATPIVVRIPERNYDLYEIPQEFRKKRYVYWRPELGGKAFMGFIKQLEDNLLKKYKEFYKKEIKVDRIFEAFRFIKPVANHVVINGQERIIIGSIWEFWFSYLHKKRKKLLDFGIDTGFGERNSLGFGFINPKIEKDKY